MNKQTRTVILIILAIYLIGVIMVFSSCNPVNNVLNDETKSRIVFNELSAKGWCANDTTIINKSDTTILFDTLYTVDTNTDTVELTNIKEVVKTKLVTKTITIRDTIKSIVVDRSQAIALQNEVNLLKNRLADQNLKISEQVDEIKTAKKSKNKAWLYLWLLIGGIGIYLFRKPLLKLISPLKFIP
jgi:hypothetical protein